ncbi:MAG TPA: hypothetical protein VE978_19300 [Chitinophagales bacterium]|nr:hypothetical protein [Chitinophagales bacterium]
MKAATVHELKEELSHLPQAQLLEMCTRLARFKKENKELLTYLLFEAHDEQAYIESVKADIDNQFAEIPKGNSLYLIKKSLRKILRGINKYIRYTGSREAEIQLRLYYCSKLKQSGIPLSKSVAISNLYQGQLKKINTVLPLLHEDLQYDFRKEAERLSESF